MGGSPGSGKIQSEKRGAMFRALFLCVIGRATGSPLQTDRVGYQRHRCRLCAEPVAADTPANNVLHWR